MPLRIEGGLADVTDQGVTVTPWFSFTALLIPWSNIMFVGATPAVKRTNGEWVTYKGEPLTTETLRRGQRFYLLQVAVHDRAAVVSSASFLVKAWVRVTLFLKPLYMANDKPHPSQGVLKLYLRRRWVRRNGVEIIKALEAAESHSGFGLICTSD